MLPTELIIHVVAYAYAGSIRRRLIHGIRSEQRDLWFPFQLRDVSATFASVIVAVSRTFAGIPFDAEITE